MEFANKYKAKIIADYQNGKSTYEIAEDLNTYSNKIRRALRFLGVKLRGYGEAQKNALKEGRVKHPTEGTKLSDETKQKISKTRAKTWASISDEERERLSNISRENWENMTDQERFDLRAKAMAAVKETVKHGTRVERFIREKLIEMGYSVMFHTKDVIKSRRLELDMFLPELRTAIEIDGPGHFSPIWGEEKFQKQQKADFEKQGLILSEGYAIIRLRQLDRNMSMNRVRSICQVVVDAVEEIKREFPPSGKRLIEIEVENGTSKRL